MNGKKLLINVIWIAVLVLLAWFFLWPISLADKLPADQNITVDIADSPYYTEVPQQITYSLKAGTAGHAALLELLDQYSCYHSISTGSRTSMGMPWEKHILIQSESQGASIYTTGTNSLILNNTYLRMGWYNNKQARAFLTDLLALLSRTDLEITSDVVPTPAA